MSTSLTLVSPASATLKTEFGFFAVWARTLPSWVEATFHSPTSLVNPLAIRPTGSSSNVHMVHPPRGETTPGPRKGLSRQPLRQPAVVSELAGCTTYLLRAIPGG